MIYSRDLPSCQVFHQFQGVQVLPSPQARPEGRSDQFSLDDPATPFIQCTFCSCLKSSTPKDLLCISKHATKKFSIRCDFCLLLNQLISFGMKENKKAIFLVNLLPTFVNTTSKSIFLYISRKYIIIPCLL